jgi:hypothetical protein
MVTASTGRGRGTAQHGPFARPAAAAAGNTQGIIHKHIYAILDVVPVEVRGHQWQHGVNAR